MNPMYTPSSRHTLRPLRSALGLAIQATLLCSTLGSALLPMTVQAEPDITRAVRSYSVPAAPLGEALNQFARQAGITLSMTPAQTAGKQSADLQGSYSTDQACSFYCKAPVCRPFLPMAATMC